MRYETKAIAEKAGLDVTELETGRTGQGFLKVSGGRREKALGITYRLLSSRIVVLSDETSMPIVFHLCLPSPPGDLRAGEVPHGDGGVPDPEGHLPGRVEGSSWLTLTQARV